MPSKGLNATLMSTKSYRRGMAGDLEDPALLMLLRIRNATATATATRIRAAECYHKCTCVDICPPVLVAKNTVNGGALL